MIKEHLLDPDSLASLPTGYTVVDSEVLFLQQGGGRQPLLVRGARLCAWAESFFRGRGQSFRYVRPVVEELRGACPELTEAQAREIVEQLGPDGLEKLAQPMTCQQVLQQLYTTSLWQDAPSTKHVAEWLVWLYQADPPDYIQPLLKQMGREWQERLNQSEQEFYSVTSKEEAGQCIERWLEGSESISFPAAIPPAIVERVVFRWQSQIVQSRGDHFAYLVKQKIPALLKEKAADGTASYYRANPTALTPQKLDELSYFLSSHELKTLYEILPPQPPEPLPSSPVGVLEWFRKSYFPYREWQNGHATSGEVREPVLQAAKQFAGWYLDHYPEALIGQELQQWLSMKRMVELTQQESVVTLVVVLDGLHAGDARDLLRKIEGVVPRLTVTTNDLVFSPLPTITQFCKPSLLAGVPPRLVGEVEEVGQVVPDRQLPIESLKQAAPGDLVLWRVEEPDSTYHRRNSSDSLLREVQGKLDTIARNLYTIVEQVPDHILLQLVVTTDHGRLLARSERTTSVPPGMESHGRAAWGRSPISFNGHSHVIEDDVAYLEAYSFGLDHDVAIVLDESAFQTNDQRGGSELYPHGGLFPEEVILPWLAFARDVKEPQLEIFISGAGTARKQGALQVHVVNMDNRLVYIRQVTLQFALTSQSIGVNWAVWPQSDDQFVYELDPWPSAEDVRAVKAEVKVGLNNQLTFDMPAKVELQSEDMYRRDNILEDLF